MSLADSSPSDDFIYRNWAVKTKTKQNKKTLNDSISAISKALVLLIGTYHIMSGCLTNKLKVNKITKNVTTSSNPITLPPLPGYVQTKALVLRL